MRDETVVIVDNSAGDFSDLMVTVGPTERECQVFASFGGPPLLVAVVMPGATSTGVFIADVFGFGILPALVKIVCSPASDLLVQALELITEGDPSGPHTVSGRLCASWKATHAAKVGA